MGVDLGIFGKESVASQCSVRRMGRRNLGIWGRTEGMRVERERKVFSMMMPETCMSVNLVSASLER